MFSFNTNRKYACITMVILVMLGIGKNPLVKAQEKARSVFSDEIDLDSKFYWKVEFFEIVDPNDIFSIENSFSEGSIIELSVRKELPKELLDEWVFEGDTYPVASHLLVKIDGTQSSALQGVLTSSAYLKYDGEFEGTEFSVRLKLLYLLLVLTARGVVTIEERFENSGYMNTNDSDVIVQETDDGTVSTRRSLNLSNGLVIYESINRSQTFCCIDEATFDFSLNIGMQLIDQSVFETQSSSETISSTLDEPSKTTFSPSGGAWKISIVLISLFPLILMRRTIQCKSA